jgi:serine/threonine protein phosphatase 1
MMSGRLIAIGDIHGCLAALQAVWKAVAPQSDDTIVLLGDYIDRGPDSRGVLDFLLQNRSACRLIPLLGNHDQMLIDIRGGRSDLISNWILFGGDATLRSYGTADPAFIPAEHIEFLRNCRYFYENNRFFFLHGSYNPSLPLEAQEPSVFIWGKLRPTPPEPHCSGKTAIVGHTTQRSGKILDLGHLKCVDTCCYGTGCLTALEVQTGEIWRADKNGL